MAQFPVEHLLSRLESLVVGEVKLLRGVADEIAEIRMELGSMRSFLKDADRRKDGDEGIKEWVGQVREAVYDIEDVLDEFLFRFRGRQQQQKGGRALVRKHLHAPARLLARHNLAKELQSIKARVVSIRERQQRYSFNALQEGGTALQARLQVRREASYDDEPDVVGIEQDTAKVIEWLTWGCSQLTPISLVGMGGSGKTTLARKVFNNYGVKSHFDCYSWVCVSQSFTVEHVLKSSIEGFYESRSERSPQGVENMDIAGLERVLRFYLQNKRYLLVLDDVWNVDVLENIRFALPNNQHGSRIMVTTRIDGIAHPIEDRVGCVGLVHHLEPLSFETAMDLFCKKAFRDDPQSICPLYLREACKDLAERCDGLPLAIVVLGGVMSRKSKSENEWRSVYDNLHFNFNDNNHQLGRLRMILSLSYDELPLHLKSCYLYCGIFPEDYPIRANRLIRLWIAEGFVENKEGTTLEEVGKQYLNELIQRSLLHTVLRKPGGVGLKECRMHDLLRALVLSTLKNENFCTVFTIEGAIMNERIRRMSLQIDNFEQISLSNQRASHLRTLIIFYVLPSSFSAMFSSFRFMRVLDLEFAPIEELPNALGDLFLLRYLNLRRTKVKRLPSSFGKLQNLQMLDLRWTPIEGLPEETSKMKNLRYICTYPRLRYSYPFDRFVGCEIPSGACMLADLQKLSGINATAEIVEMMRSLTKLKNLAIFRVKGEHGRNLCASIAEMKDLLTLRIFGISEEETLQLQHLTNPPRHLEDVKLCARLEELPHWISSMNNLTRLELVFSGLNQDPFSSLQSLQNLVRLNLHKAYNGRELRCSAGVFPKLKELFLIRLARLEKVRVEDTAMPGLEKLVMGECSEMKRMPRGIQHLTALQQLNLIDMPEELIRRIKTDGRKDRAMVQHVSTIMCGAILDDGTFTWERLQ